MRFILTNQLASDQGARDKVFHAGQRLFALSEDQKDAAVDCFAKTNRIGAVAIGLVSVAFAIKAIQVVWNRNQGRRSGN